MWEGPRTLSWALALSTAAPEGGSPHRPPAGPGEWPLTVRRLARGLRGARGPPVQPRPRPPSSRPQCPGCTARTRRAAGYGPFLSSTHTSEFPAEMNLADKANSGFQEIRFVIITTGRATNHNASLSQQKRQPLPASRRVLRAVGDPPATPGRAARTQGGGGRQWECGADSAGEETRSDG